MARLFGSGPLRPAGEQQGGRPLGSRRDGTRARSPRNGSIAFGFAVALPFAGRAAAQETASPADTGAADLRLFRAAVDSERLFGINASEVTETCLWAAFMTGAWNTTGGTGATRER